MKKAITKITATVLAAVLTLTVMGCKGATGGDEPPAENPPTENPPAEQKAGDIVSAGIKIGEKTYAKTSEVAIVPEGKTGEVDMKDDSSWNTYVTDSVDAYWKGVFIKNRKVTLSPFVMSQYEVTQELYTAVMEVENPSHFKNNSETGETQEFRPVEQVNHYEAAAFCNELTKKTMTASDVVYFSNKEKTAVYTKDDATNQKEPYMDITKKGYRLPTEAEWEYAARGGNPNVEAWKNAFSKYNTKDGKMIYDGNDSLKEDENLGKVGWYRVYKTHEVGLKEKNSLNLYDMAGNVWEWCWDWYADVETGTVADPCGAADGSERVNRGGGFGDDAFGCACSFRDGFDGRDVGLGFRVVRSSSK